MYDIVFWRLRAILPSDSELKFDIPLEILVLAAQGLMDTASHFGTPIWVCDKLNAAMPLKAIANTNALPIVLMRFTGITAPECDSSRGLVERKKRSANAGQRSGECDIG